MIVVLPIIIKQEKYKAVFATLTEFAWWENTYQPYFKLTVNVIEDLPLLPLGQQEPLILTLLLTWFLGLYTRAVDPSHRSLPDAVLLHFPNHVVLSFKNVMGRRPSTDRDVINCVSGNL